MREIVTLALKDIIPYERNPRKNDAAVDDVAESIRQVGYRLHEVGVAGFDGIGNGHVHVHPV